MHNHSQIVVSFLTDIFVEPGKLILILHARLNSYSNPKLYFIYDFCIGRAPQDSFIQELSCLLHNHNFQL